MIDPIVLYYFSQKCHQKFTPPLPKPSLYHITRYSAVRDNGISVEQGQTAPTSSLIVLCTLRF